MDPISTSALTAVLTKVFDGAAQEVGGRLWTGLTRLIGRSFGRRSRTAAAALDERRGDSDAIHALAEALAAEAARDSTAAVWLREWMDGAERALRRDDSVTNTIGGNVTGKVVQARDIQGDITL